MLITLLVGFVAATVASFSLGVLLMSARRENTELVGEVNRLQGELSQSRELASGKIAENALLQETHKYLVDQLRERDEMVATCKTIIINLGAMGAEGEIDYETQRSPHGPN